MQTVDPLPEKEPNRAIVGSKAIVDLDDLVQAILKATPESKPWQRQLRAQLLDVERHIQVLRLTISLARSQDEVTAAVESIRKTLRASYNHIAAGRADIGTKAAVRFALELSQKISCLPVAG